MVTVKLAAKLGRPNGLNEKLEVVAKVTPLGAVFTNHRLLAGSSTAGVGAALHVGKVVS
jgi:hypothetical protein